MLISENLLITLEKIANTSLKYSLVASETEYTREIENLLRVRPIIYYRRIGRVASQFGWEEPKIWKTFAQSKKLSLTKIKTFKLLYGIHKSKKYGVGFIIPYEESINLQEINEELTKLFKSHIKKQVREQPFRLYDDQESKALVIIEPYQTSKKENTNHAKSNHAKPSTI
jgi:hypothetical protein